MEESVDCKERHVQEGTMVCMKCYEVLCAFCTKSHIMKYEHQAFLVPISVGVFAVLRDQASCVGAIDALEQFAANLAETTAPVLRARMPDHDYHRALEIMKEVMAKRHAVFVARKESFMAKAQAIQRKIRDYIQRRQVIKEELFTRVKQLSEEKKYYESLMQAIEIERLSKQCEEEEMKLHQEVPKLWEMDPRELSPEWISVAAMGKRPVEVLIRKYQAELDNMSSAFRLCHQIADQARNVMLELGKLQKATFQSHKRELNLLLAKQSRAPPAWFVHHFVECDPQHLYLCDFERKAAKLHTISYPKVTKTALASAQQDNSIYITGGFNGKDYLTTTLECRVQSDLSISSKFKANMIVGKDYHALVAVANIHGKFIYSLGGHNKEERLAICEKFSVAEDKWMLATPLPFAWCALGGCCAVGQKVIYIFDGSPTENAICSLRTDNLGATWDVLTFNNPVKWQYMNYGGAIDIGGGEVLVFLQSKQSYIYNTLTSTFTNVYKMPQGDRFFQTYPVASKSHVVAIGLDTSNLYRFSLKKRQWTIFNKSVWMLA